MPRNFLDRWSTMLDRSAKRTRWSDVEERQELPRSAADDRQGLMVLSAVFDDAWQRIEAHYRGDDLAAAEARAALAIILLHLATVNIADGDRLRNSALVSLAMTRPGDWVRVARSGASPAAWRR
jgi:hypothetical protein